MDKKDDVLDELDVLDKIASDIEKESIEMTNSLDFKELTQLVEKYRNKKGA